MKEIVFYCSFMFNMTFNRVRIYDEDSHHLTSARCFFIDDRKTLQTSFFSRETVTTEHLTIKELENRLYQSDSIRMITIATENCRIYSYEIIATISHAKGICIPFVECQNVAIIFPELRYSDIGLLRYFCEQNDLHNYKILLASIDKGECYV